MADHSKQLITQVKSALAKQAKVTIQGGGTKQHIGRRTDPENVEKISTLDHSGVVEYNPVELVMTARAGTTLAEIDAALDEHGQMLACDPRRFSGQATVGGSLAANQSGPARPWTGSFRDHVLGIRLINGQGDYLRFGGQVMKNVAGYDVSRLQAGAMGSLGIITEISFKVLPKPAISKTLAAEMDSSQAMKLMNELSRSAKPLSGLCWVDNVLYLRLEGAKKSVESTEKKWSSEHGLNQLESKAGAQFWHNLREHELSFFSHDLPLWKWSVRPSAQLAMTNESWLLDWRGARRWLKGDFDLETLSELAKTLSGEVQLYQGAQPDQEVATVQSEAMKTIMMNLKKSFDPKNIFNSGRLYSWL